MATDYDAPRTKNAEDTGDESLEELTATPADGGQHRRHRWG